MIVSAAPDRLIADDENVNICQFVAICFAYEIYNAMVNQRCQQLRLLFFFKMVRGLVPAVPAEKYVYQQI
jgi:hypothetical protein